MSTPLDLVLAALLSLAGGVLFSSHLFTVLALVAIVLAVAELDELAEERDPCDEFGDDYEDDYGYPRGPGDWG